jgi:hypothetical protein
MGRWHFTESLVPFPDPFSACSELGKVDTCSGRGRSGFAVAKGDHSRPVVIVLGCSVFPTIYGVSNESNFSERGCTERERFLRKGGCQTRKMVVAGSPSGETALVGSPAREAGLHAARHPIEPLKRVGLV